MNEHEAAKLVYMAAANFPGMAEKGTKESWKDTVKLWSIMLSDIPYELGEAALVRVLSQVRFFPAISELRQAIAEIVDPEIITPEQAWKLAWSSVGYDLSDLPEDVGLIAGYLDMDKPVSSDPQSVSVLRSQFIAAYKRERKEYREHTAIPGNLDGWLLERAGYKALAAVK